MGELAGSAAFIPVKGWVVDIYLALHPDMDVTAGAGIDEVGCWKSPASAGSTVMCSMQAATGKWTCRHAAQVKPGEGEAQLLESDPLVRLPPARSPNPRGCLTLEASWIHTYISRLCKNNCYKSMCCYMKIHGRTYERRIFW